MKSAHNTVQNESSDSFLVITDVPAGLEFGIDCITYDTGPKFRGLSLLPSGLHFIYHSTGLGSRQGFFIEVGNKDIVVKSWDSVQEEILPYNTLSENSLHALHKAVITGELNDNLGPYPLQQYHHWKNMTGLITASVLRTADCSPGTLIFPGDDAEIIEIDKTNRSKQSKRGVESSAIKPYFSDIARVARFTDIPSAEMELIESIGLNDLQRSSRITTLMMDKSTLLENLIQNSYHSSELSLLGEMQLSFMLFILLYSYPALKQWKMLVHTVCCSERYLHSKQAFTAAFMRVLYSQLSFAPADFFDNELSMHNFLRPAITALFSSLSNLSSSNNTSDSNNNNNNSNAVDDNLIEHKKRMRRFLEKKFNLQLHAEFGENSMIEVTRTAKGEEVGHGVGNDNDGIYSIIADDDEENLPTFVSEEELRGYYDRNNSNEESNINVTDTNCTITSTLSDNTVINNSNSSGGLFQSKWAVIDKALQQATSSATMISTNNAVGTDSLSLQCNNNNPTAAANGIEMIVNKNISSNIEVVGVATTTATLMTSTEKEAALYSWRYPLVYEAMLQSAGKEDMTMTAVRILEEFQQQQLLVSEHTSNNMAVDTAGVINEHSRLRFKEAEQFIEYEIIH